MPAWYVRNEAASRAAERSIVRDSLVRLGARPIASQAGAAAELAAQAGAAGTIADVIEVPQGSLVVADVAGRRDAWVVVGQQAGDGALELVRRSEAGMTRATVDGSRLLLENPHLAAGHTVADVIADQFGTPGATIRISAPADTPARELVGSPPPHLATIDVEAPSARHPLLSETQQRPWLQVYRQSLADARVRVTGPAHVGHAWNIAHEATGTSLGVVDAIAGHAGGRLVALGPDGTAGEAGRVARSVADTRAWFQRVHGVSPGTVEGWMIAAFNDPDLLGNAGMDSRGAMTFGLLPDTTRHVFSEMDRGERALARRGMAISRNLDGVVAHEFGHWVTNHYWPADAVAAVADGGAAPSARAIERDIVEEAISDIFGAQRTGKARVAFRDLRALRNGWGTVDQLRSSIARSLASGGTWDVHAGTQVLTQPVARWARTFGWDAAGEITMAAVRRTGDALDAGRIAHVDMTAVASALRESVAWRHGVGSKAWSLLDDLLRHVRL